MLSLNTGGGVMFWQRGPTFTFLIGDTVSVTTSGHRICWQTDDGPTLNAKLTTL